MTKRAAELRRSTTLSWWIYENEVVIAAQEWCRGQSASVVVLILAFLSSLSVLFHQLTPNILSIWHEDVDNVLRWLRSTVLKAGLHTVVNCLIGSKWL